MSAHSSDPLVFVGIDGSDGAVVALRWAAANLDHLGGLQPVTAWNYPWWAITPPFGGAPAPPPDDFFENEAREDVRAAAEKVGPVEVLPPLVFRGHTGRTLVDAAASGDVLVVGTRGRGAIAGSLLGSTSSYCAANSTVPIVVVPEHIDPDAPIEQVAVGVDGSPNSYEALVWALRHTPEDAVVEVHYAWITATALEGLTGKALDEIELRSNEMVADMVHRATVEAQAGDRAVVTRLAMGDPRTMLRGAEADLVVIGARGHRGFAHLLLGSTASALVHHPRTATVVVPHHEPGDDA